MLKHTHNESVTKIQEGRCESFNIQFCKEVVDTIEEQIECSESTCQKGSPPPSVILTKSVKQFYKIQFLYLCLLS